MRPTQWNIRKPCKKNCLLGIIDVGFKNVFVPIGPRRFGTASRPLRCFFSFSGWPASQQRWRTKKDEGDAGVGGAIAHAFCISDRI